MRKLKRVPWCLFLIVFLTIGTIIMIYPFIWMVSASFKEVAEMYQIPPTVIPRNPTIKNYLVVFQQMGLLAAMYLIHFRHHLHGGYDGSGAADDYSQLLYCQGFGADGQLGKSDRFGSLQRFCHLLNSPVFYVSAFRTG